VALVEHLVFNQVVGRITTYCFYGNRVKGRKEQQVEKTCEIFSNMLFLLIGAPGEIRTPDRLVRSQSTHFYLFY